MAGADLDRAHSALASIPPDLPRGEWHMVGRAAIAAGLTVDDLVAWSSTASNFKSAEDVRAAFRTIKPEGGTGPGTLFHVASQHGWSGDAKSKPIRVATTPVKGKARASETMPHPAAGMSAGEVLARCHPATLDHPYIESKAAAGVPLDSLRVVPAGDPLRVAGESMAGALVVPVLRPDGSASSLQLIPPPEVAARLKAAGKPAKLNLPRTSMEGWFTVGELAPGGTAYLCEGIGQAWACWKATGATAVVCFGWGRVRAVAEALRRRDASARLVLVPDAGKEQEAERIAQDTGCAFVPMPVGWPANSDVCDLAQRDGIDALEVLLSAPNEVPQPAPRFTLLSASDLAALPPLRWCVRGVLPAQGVAALYGPSASGKSFLGLDLAAAIADGRPWFGHRVTRAPVVYVVLEGEAGFRTRAQAWEMHHGGRMPEGLNLVLQPFKLTEAQDVDDLAAVVPAGAVVFVDTLNRAAPTADENTSKDMGGILEAVKRLRALTGGLVVLVHHTGKDSTKGLRGHSSLFASLDAAIEVTREGDRRAWSVTKSKDGADGDVNPFRLRVLELGHDEHGDPITSCAVVPDLAADEVQRVKLPQGGNQRLVLDALRPLFKDGRTGKPGAPPLRPCIELEAAVRAGAASLSCPTDKRTSRAREAITGLASRGVLRVHDGWLWLV